MTRNTVKIAQISDLHLFENKEKTLLGVNTYQSFSHVLDLLKSDTTQPDIILLTGDVSQDHSKMAYQHVVDAFSAWTIPIYYVPGNHDDKKWMVEVLSTGTISNLKHILLEGWQLILLDSQKVGAVEGSLSPTQLDFLETCLKTYPMHRAILVFHHQPVSVGARWLDQLGLQNADELWAVLARYPNSHTILFGHVHQEYQNKKNGINCLSVPSTCIQFKRNNAEFALEELPPAYRWIELSPTGDFKTAVCRVARYVGVFDAEAKGY